MRSSIPWSEQEIVTPNIPNTGSKLLQPLPHFENYCSDSMRRYRLPSGHVSFLPSPRCLVTPALSPHLLFVWCSFFCFPILSQCAGWSGRPTGDEHLQPMLCSEGGGRKETHFPELRTLRATFKIKPQALSLHADPQLLPRWLALTFPRRPHQGSSAEKLSPGLQLPHCTSCELSPTMLGRGFAFPARYCFAAAWEPSFQQDDARSRVEGQSLVLGFATLEAPCAICVRMLFCANHQILAQFCQY